MLSYTSPWYDLWMSDKLAFIAITAISIDLPKPIISEQFAQQSPWMANTKN